MDWMDRRDIAQAKRDEMREKQEPQSTWEEYDVDELGRLMMAASALEDGVREFDPPHEEMDGDWLDAQYYARKLYRIISRLAVKAEREWKASAGSEAR